MDRPERLAAINQLLEQYSGLDEIADQKEDAHDQSVVTLDNAHTDAQEINAAAEQLLLIEEAAAASAYDAALGAARLKRQGSRDEAVKLVADAQAAEELALDQKNESREMVASKFEEIVTAIKALAAA
jgi:hypothetical protein